MIRIFAFILFLANISVAGDINTTEPTTGKSTVWSFVGRDGPDKWNSLDKKFQDCKADQKASILITDKDLAINGSPITFDYKAYAYPPVSVAQSKNMKLGNETYKLVEFHIHLPAKHYINGKLAKSAVHFVHQNSNKEIAVVAVMIKEGKSNPVIKNLIETVNDGPKARFAIEDGNLTALLPVNKEYYYDKSTITTSPCVGKVSWHIMKDPIEASAEELIGLRETIAIK
jgi:carbonic anhydrase